MAITVSVFENGVDKTAEYTGAVRVDLGAVTNPPPPIEPPPTGGTESPDGTIVAKKADLLTDASGNTWTVDETKAWGDKHGFVILVNGQPFGGPSYGCYAYRLIYKNHAVIADWATGWQDGAGNGYWKLTPNSVTATSNPF